ncbi:hypothetical protein PRK78_002486 [Emydomyces testavorans]|uniref:Uncharacterized protein n=1 Tax=Emydomyces testavorans TaxID=2070801 RepID=A0AAF0IHM3_9EURO|nr:hypothetical protein PRK78_002486 [Emydomyces testavorans]
MAQSGQQSSSLSEDIQAELRARQDELANLQQEQIRLMAFINDAKQRAAELAQMSSSASAARGGRQGGLTTMTPEQEIAKHEQDLADVAERLKIVRATIDLLFSK